MSQQPPNQPPAEQGFFARTRPWKCEACGKKNISANDTTCPQCFEPRYGSTAASGSKATTWRERARPWTCAVCGRQVAPATHSCPNCGAPRAGTPEAQAEEASGQTTRVYEGEKALQAGIAAMARAGWRVVSQTSFQPRAGAGRILAIGIAAALFKPPMKWTVVFERIPPTAQP